MSRPLKRGNVKILLLGAGGRLLTYRRRIRNQLNRRGYANIIIMEDISDKISDRGIGQKFAEILRQYDPNFIFAFFHKGEKMNAVVFEIGYVCCLYGDSIKNRLKILHEVEYDFVNETCAYIDDLLPEINHSKFDDSIGYRRAVNIIYRMISTY